MKPGRKHKKTLENEVHILNQLESERASNPLRIGQKADKSFLQKCQDQVMAIILKRSLSLDTIVMLSKDNLFKDSEKFVIIIIEKFFQQLSVMLDS